MGPLLAGTYQLPEESAEVFNEGVHQRLEFWIWQSCNHPSQQKKLHESVPILHQNCQWTSKFPLCTHCIPRNLSRSPRNTSTCTIPWSWKASNTHECQSSFFPHTILLPYGTAYIHMYPVIAFFSLNRLCFDNNIPHITLDTNYFRS